MKIVLSDKVFFLDFKHFIDAEPGSFERLKSHPDTTVATLYEDKEAKKVVGTGTAHCCLGDQFSRKVGRKLALSRLLDKYFYPDSDLFGTEEQVRRVVNDYKQKRKSIWAQYFAQVKK